MVRFRPYKALYKHLPARTKRADARLRSYGITRRRLLTAGAIAAGGYAYGGRTAAMAAGRALLNRYQYHPAVAAGRAAYGYVGSRYVLPFYKGVMRMKYQRNARLAYAKYLNYRRNTPMPLRDRAHMKNLLRLSKVKYPY
jgi:hypothetical protein